MQAVKGNAAFRRLLDAARARRVDFIITGDSNVANYNAGHFRAMELALSDSTIATGLQLYASSYVPGGQHIGIAGVGDSARYKGSGWNISVAATPWGTTGAGTTIDDQTGAPDILGQEYIYLDTAEATTVGVGHNLRAEGATFTAGSATEVGGRLIGNTVRFDVHCAEFASGGGDITLRRQLGAGGVEVKANQTFGTTDGDVTVVSMTADTWATGTEATFNFGTVSTNHTDGKCAVLGIRGVNTARSSGAAVSSWYRVGGTSSQDAFNASTGTIQTQPDSFFAYYFNEICNDQTATVADQVACFPVIFGHNELGDSVTKAIYTANLQRFIDKVTARWTATGRSAANLYFMLIGPHGVAGDQSSAGNALLRSLGDACTELAGTNNNTCAINPWALIGDGNRFDALGYHDAGGDAHLSVAGYAAVINEGFSALLSGSVRSRNFRARAGGYVR